MTLDNRARSQAIIVMHGMGEQRPMQTLRSFTKAIVGGSSPEKQYLSKPDRISGSFELRRLRAYETGHRPSTDFYEFYWAHLMRGTQLKQLTKWLRTLLIRKPCNVPAKLKPLWWLTVISAIAAVALWVRTFMSPEPKAIGITAVGITFILGVVQGIILNSLGDAARYLDPHPDNVASRHAIRTAGFETIKRMHESGKYERIVLVGHSLGSVIGYDIINHLWQCYSSTFNKPDAWPDHLRSADLRKKAQPALQAVQESGTALEQSPNPPDDSAISSFQKAQRSCWLEFREMGNPWLITDFISVGSPLAHASMLMARNQNELDERKRDRELPTCPPSTSGKETYSYKDKPYVLNGQTRFVRVPHHAAPFVCTRWTNIYYPVRYGFFGDIVGGPLNGRLGRGIRDVPLTGTSIRNLPFLPHIRYWKRGIGGDPKEAIAALIDAVGVNSKSWLDRS